MWPYCCAKRAWFTQCWSKGKNEIMNSEYHETFADLRNRVSEYYRTTKFNFDIYKYINRKTSEYA